MKKQDLLNYVNDELLDKLYGFCYTRTNDSYEAEELCSDIVFALVKAARADGEIENVYLVITSIGLMECNWKSKESREEYLTIWSDELDEETAYLTEQYLTYG